MAASPDDRRQGRSLAPWRRAFSEAWSEALTELGPFPVAFFLIVVVAAGTSGVVLLIAPGSSQRYFSWTLRPPAAAALVGGFYLASAAVFGWALTLPWRQARTLVVGVLGLAVPTLVLTLVHDEVFDFGRWQALAWVGLFVAAPLSATAMLSLPWRQEGRRRKLSGWSRTVLAVLAASFATVAALVWLDATRDDVSRVGPMDLLRLTGTYLGAWCSFLAVLCGWASARGTWDEARASLVTVGAAAGGALVAFLRSLGELRHPVASLSVATGVVVLAVVTYRSAGRASN